jgi:hypothetical protein
MKYAHAAQGKNIKNVVFNKGIGFTGYLSYIDCIRKRN